MRAPDKQIAQWLGVSLPTYYRWRSAGLLSRRPESSSVAREMRTRIDAALETAIVLRPSGMLGRTTLEAVVKALGDNP